MPDEPVSVISGLSVVPSASFAAKPIVAAVGVAPAVALPTSNSDDTSVPLIAVAEAPVPLIALNV